ncbi:RNA-binding protein Raly-like [Oncorhynchus mykiss]|uniref:RNA-binding protein Raly-like n=1 Tax=Oncorhynchus mykiss TaxID=8022 RepID=UPI0018775645|nr:RNA-binding protein Raly-like [Oncorhynchus mykiss]
MSLKVHTSNDTNKNDPKSINSHVFIGNLNTAVVKKSDVESIFLKYGRVLGCSVHKGYAFVQYASERHARGSVIGENGRVMAGQTLDINMAEEPKPNRPRGRKRFAAGLYSGYDFDNDYYRDEFYDRLFEYWGRVSPVPRIVPVKWPHMAMPLVRQVNYLPAKLLARTSLLPSSIKQKCKFLQLQAIQSELTQFKFNIDALLGRVEQITEDKHFTTTLQRALFIRVESTKDPGPVKGSPLVSADNHSSFTVVRGQHAGFRGPKPQTTQQTADTQQLTSLSLIFEPLADQGGWLAEITSLLSYQFLAATLTQGSSDTSVPGDLPPSPSSHGHLGMACERRNVTDLTLKIIDMDPFTCSLYGNKWIYLNECELEGQLAVTSTSV